MSKIGKKPITVPAGVNISVDGRKISVTGPKGTVEKKFSDRADIKIEAAEINVSVKGKSKSEMSIWGTTRAILANMVTGVTDGFKKELELVGTGYRAEVSSGNLILTIGYSHPVTIPAPDGVTFEVQKSIIGVSGSDRELVGQVASEVRKVRPPEPYQGKGIKYTDEFVRRKAGKAAKTAAS